MRELRYSILADIQDAIEQAKQGKLALFWQRTIQREYSGKKVTPDEQQAYDLIRKIEYVKYHFFPKGYMIRTSSRSHKEVVRLSKSAVNSGASFEKIGNLLIDKYKSNPAVKAVHLFFVTDKSVDYKMLESLAVKNHSITEP